MALIICRINPTAIAWNLTKAGWCVAEIKSLIYTDFILLPMDLSVEFIFRRGDLTAWLQC
jgi:hypothetical protein